MPPDGHTMHSNIFLDKSSVDVASIAHQENSAACAYGVTMSLKLMSLDDAIGKEHEKVILYGDAGVGKTTQCASLPGQKIILSAEKGLKSLKNLPAEVRAQCRAVEVRTIDGLKEAYNLIKSGEWKCDWLVMDSISEFAEIALAEHKRTKKDARAAYGTTEDDIMAMLWDFQALPVHVLFLCKEQVKPRQISDDTSIDYFNLLMPGQTLTSRVSHLVDELWRLTVRGGKRMLITQADGRSRCKSRGGLSATIDVTDGLSDVVEMLTAAPDDEAGDQ